MRKFSFLFFILSSLNAQLTVSILDFKGTGVKNTVLRACYNQLEESLIESNRFTVIDKVRGKNYLRSNNFKTQGYVMKSVLLRLGNWLGLNS